MTTRPFTDCRTLALALCGVPDTNAAEVARVDAFLNLAFRKAYDESDYWPRFLRTEERVVSEDGLLPYSEDGKDDIGVCRRIFATEPFAECGAAEYPNFYAGADGIQIAGYRSDGTAGMVVTGPLSPGGEGTYLLGEDIEGKASYSFGVGGVTYPQGAINWDGVYWRIFGGVSANDGFFFRSNEDVATPDLATTWVGLFASSGVPVVTATTIFSAWVTYKAAFTETYTEGDEIPAEWFDFAANWAAAMFIAQDGVAQEGNLKMSAMMQAQAMGYLQAQLEKLDNQSGGHVYTRNINHGNTQAR